MKGQLLILASAVGAVAAAYGGTLHNGFHFDDGHSIEDNAFLEDLRHIPRYFYDLTTFSPLAENRSYRPILLMGFALSEWMGDGAPWAYHLLTLLLHAVGAAVVGLLTQRLLRTGYPDLEPTTVWATATLAAAVFAAHPLVSEPVNYISSRSSLQAAVFGTASVLLYIDSREHGGRRALAGSYLLLGLALLTKLTAVSVPVLVLLWELTIGRRRATPWRHLAIRVAPFFAVSGLFAVFHEAFVGSSTRAARSDVTPYHYFLTESRVWQRFLGLFVWPEDLCADLTMRWSQSPWEGSTARALLLAAALLLGAWAIRRRWPMTALGIAWFYVTLAPTNSIVPLAEPASEHRVYIALPGLVFVVAEVGARWATRLGRPGRFALLTAAIAAAVGLAAAARVRSTVWRDDVTLWASVIECAPDNGRAHLNYGRGKWAAQDLGAARTAFERCKALWPHYAYCDINLAALALAEGRLDDAARHAGSAQKLAPNNVYSQVWSAKVLLAQKKPTAALAAFKKARRIAPGYGPAEQGYAVARFELGELQAAKQALRPFAERNQLDAPGWFAWGFLQERDGQPKQAEQAYLRTLSLDAKHRRARYNLARLLQVSGHTSEAIEHYRYLVSLGDPAPEVMQNLTAALRAPPETRPESVQKN